MFNHPAKIFLFLIIVFEMTFPVHFVFATPVNTEKNASVDSSVAPSVDSSIDASVNPSVDPSNDSSVSQRLRLLSHNPHWRNLLHLPRKEDNPEVSRVQGPFFLSMKESGSLAFNELAVTLDQMKDPRFREGIQCRFLARRDFLIESGLLSPSEVVRCPRWENWKTQLQAEKMELIYASAYMNSAASSFGHTFLRLKTARAVDSNFLDYGINFAARTNQTTGALYALYGLFGFFPANYGMAPIHQMIKEYTHLEGRDLWQFSLNLRTDEIERMLKHLWELESAYFDYYFLDDNCSALILRLLEVGRPGLHLIDDEEAWVIPIDTLKSIRQGGLIESVGLRKSQKSKWIELERKLNSADSKRIRALNDALAKEKDHPPDLSSFMTSELEALQLYFSTLPYTPEMQKKSFSLNTERARRGGLSTGTDSSQEIFGQSEVSPEMAHPSSQIRGGAGISNGLSELRLRFRPALHNSLESDLGLAEGSELEVLVFEGRHKENKSRFLWDLIRVRNQNPWGLLSHPLSWGFSLGYDESFYGDFQTGFVFRGTDSIKVSPQIFFRAQEENHSPWRSGAQFEISITSFSWLRVASLVRWYGRSQNTSGVSVTFNLALDFTRNQGLEYRQERRWEGESRLEDDFLWYRWNFSL